MWETILGAVLGGSGGAAVVGMVFKYLSDRRADKLKKDANERQALTEDHERHVQRLEKRVDVLEAAHDACQKENAALREQVGKLQEAVVRLERQLSMQGRGGV